MLLNCDVGEDSWESLGLPVHSKVDQSWVFIGRTEAEAEAPIFWPPDAKNWLLWKDPDAGKDWRQEEKGTTEDEMVGGHHQLDEHEFEQALRIDDEQGSLVGCSSWCHRVRHNLVTELNWTYLFVLQTSESVMLWERNALRSELHMGSEDTAVIRVPFTADYFPWFYIRPHT